MVEHSSTITSWSPNSITALSSKRCNDWQYRSDEQLSVEQWNAFYGDRDRFNRGHLGILGNRWHIRYHHRFEF